MVGSLFSFDANKETPQSAARRRALAEAIMGRSMAPQNVGQGFGAIADGIVANVQNRRANAAETAGQQGANSLFDSIVGGITNGTPIQPSGFLGGIPTGGGEQLDPASARVQQAHGGSPYRDAIASIESAGSGDYSAIGPTHKKLGRALGRYQVMEANIGPWSEKHLGRRVSADEFMANPAIQDAIFDGEFGEYVNRFGPEGAAQAWFGGEGGVGRLNRRDSLGTSIGEYTQKFNNAIGQQTPAAAATEAMASGQMPPQMNAFAGPEATSLSAHQFNADMPMAGGGGFGPMEQQQPMQMAQAGGGMPMRQPQQQSGPSIQELMQAASNPWLNEGQRAVINSMLQQQMQAQDPYRQLQMQQGQLGLEKSRLEIDALRNPRQDPTDTMRNLEWRAQQSGLRPGTPEYQEFIMTGGRNDGVTVNVGDGSPGLGKLSADYGYVLDPHTREPVIDPQTGLPTAAPVPGSPAARAIEAEEDAAASARRNAADYARTVNQDVGIADDYLSSIMDSPFGGDGVIGANLRERRAGIAGTPEYNMKQFVDSALSNVTLDTMNRMRETSAAGATGMGNMSDRQVRIIQGILGNWQPGLPVEDQRYILHRLGNFYMDVQYGSQAERAEAVRDGRMTPEENAAIQEFYYPETRDARGRRIDTNKPVSEMTDEELEALANGNR